MAQSVSNFCTTSIRYLFYSFFILVPLVFVGNTYELFEFNKMWVAFGISILVVLAWIVKSIATRQFVFQRTPLDIPILLFLLSQFISTAFSLDTHVSVWGYYSRFNGGLLSMICYTLLYFAFVSNLQRKDVRRLISISIFTGLLTALWGFPSHFGHDPTCLVFRGSLDVSCWTDAFKPTVRMFSSLGQPDWFAAYLAVLLPLSLAKACMLVQNAVTQKNGSIFSWKFFYYTLVSILFYVDLMWTDSKGGFIGIWAALIIFAVLLIIGSQKQFVKKLFDIKVTLAAIVVFLIISFFVGVPAVTLPIVGSIQKYTLAYVQQLSQNQATNPQTGSATTTTQSPPPTPVAGELGSTDSGKIRLYVWHGAIDIWKANPLFGTGVETFAYAYYRFRPVGHNMTTEWDFLYNKAHNEYLNYLATTGAFGLGTYLAMIGWFLFTTFKRFPTLFAKISEQQKQQGKSRDYLLVSAFIAGYISILITNFFGFSVVILNAYLFLIPAFVYFLVLFIDSEKSLSFGPGLLTATNNTKKYPNGKIATTEVSLWQWSGITVLSIIALIMLIQLIRFWQADVAYALGYNYDQAAPSTPANQQAQLYEQAYNKLHEAVSIRNDEPVFLDELALNDSVIATGLAGQKQQDQANQVAQEAVSISDQVVTQHPNNVVFWKNRVRMFYTLAQAQPQYISQALDAAKHAQALAPTDAKISYNVGLLQGQSGDTQDAITTLQNTVKLKPDYDQAYYALALIYHEAAVDKNGKVTDDAMQQKAVDTMNYLLKNVQPGNADAEKTLKEWAKQ